MGVADAASAFARFLRLDLDSPDADGGGFATLPALMVGWDGFPMGEDEEICLRWFPEQVQGKGIRLSDGLWFWNFVVSRSFQQRA